MCITLVFNLGVAYPALEFFLSRIAVTKMEGWQSNNCKQLSPLEDPADPELDKNFL